MYIPGAADIRENGIQNDNDTIKVNKMDREQMILDYIKNNGNISMSKATEIWGYKARSATRKIIDKLLQKNLIEKVGKGPNTLYKLSDAY